jgi:hypothetical protein
MDIMIGTNRPEPELTRTLLHPGQRNDTIREL